MGLNIEISSNSKIVNFLDVISSLNFTYLRISIIIILFCWNVGLIHNIIKVTCFLVDIHFLFYNYMNVLSCYYSSSVYLLISCCDCQIF